MPDTTISVMEMEPLIEELSIEEQSLAEWQSAHIKEGLRQAEAGEFASDAEVKAAFDMWKNKC